MSFGNLCTRNLYIFFYHPQIFPAPPAPESLFSRVACKLNHRCTLLCLTSFAEHNIIGSHLCCPSIATLFLLIADKYSVV